MVPNRMADDQLLWRSSYAELNDLFRAGECGPVPDGRARGTAILVPGASIGRVLARVVRIVGWQGKTFDAVGDTLLNRITPFGLAAIRAKVYRDASWLDGKDCLVLDYSRTSLVARWIRDEIRLVSPRRSLGKVYVGRSEFVHFVLEFGPPDSG